MESVFRLPADPCRCKPPERHPPGKSSEVTHLHLERLESCYILNVSLSGGTADHHRHSPGARKREPWRETNCRGFWIHDYL